MKRVYLSLLFLAVMAFASSASACEICKGWAGQTTCWSGQPTGYQWCYGGWGNPCELGDWCDTRQGLAAPVTPSEQVCADGPLGCASQPGAVDAAPSGFALERPSPMTAKRMEQSS